MQVKSWICAFASAVSMTMACGCASDEFSPTHTYTKKEPAPIPTAPPVEDASGAPGKRDPDAPKEFTKTESGLKYRILRKATGPKPKSDSHVVVNYQGSLDDGTIFDSSYRKRQPFPFKMTDSLVKGWVEGMYFVNQGGMIELEIPYHLGYGAAGMPPTIPPAATLHFIIELLEVH